MRHVVRAFPLRASREALDAFAAQLKGRRAADAAAFYRRYGVAVESWHVQETPIGPWVIAVTILADPAEAAPRFAQASEEFESWFKAEVLALTGIDQNVAPLGPPSTQVLRGSAG
jgi:hypothetical protein